ncbi:MAG: FN3 associated domain-containing protein, partial [Bacteroidota bacterium]
YWVWIDQNGVEKHFSYFEKNNINYSKAIYDIKIIVDSTEEQRGLHISFDALHDETDEIHYTIDGSDPRAELPVLDPDIKIYNSAIVKAALFRNGNQEGKIAEQKFEINKATGKKIALATQPSEKYNIGGKFTLVNGIIGDLPWKSSDWLGFSGDNLIATIDFGKQENFSSVIVDALEANTSWIYLPKSVEVFSSDDGINFKTLKKISSEEIKQMKRKLILNVGNSKAQFIKIVAENFGIIPDGLAGVNNPAWLFVDEIIVE